MNTLNKRKILFFRDYKGFTGGHLKFWHYLCHTKAHPQFSPQLFMTATSVQDANIPWLDNTEIIKEWKPDEADLLFVAGLDWHQVPENLPRSIPVINLLQHVRHAVPTDPRYRFLYRPAIRICVSHEVENAVKRTGIANGPILTIPAALDIDVNFRNHVNKLNPSQKIFIDGIKNPKMAIELHSMLKNLGVASHFNTNRIPRKQYLDTLASFPIVVLLPNKTEGFYLPALEAMNFGAIVICPDCVGNREFCIDGLNCLKPAYEVGSLAQSVLQALQLSESDREFFLSNATTTVENHGFSNESENYLGKVLDNLDVLWAQVKK